MVSPGLVRDAGDDESRGLLMLGEIGTADRTARGRPRLGNGVSSEDEPGSVRHARKRGNSRIDERLDEARVVEVVA
jgi:hypothetical protein